MLFAQTFHTYRKTSIFILIVLAVGIALQQGRINDILRQGVLEVYVHIMNRIPRPEPEFLPQDSRDELRKWKLKALSLQDENKQLRYHLNFVERHHFKPLTTRILSPFLGGSTKNLVVGVGEDRGVHVGCPVISPQGLVGRIYQTSKHGARILTLVDRRFRVAVRFSSSGAEAILEGDGNTGLGVRRFRNHLRPQDGELVLTSGTGGVFPAGILVGTHRGDRLWVQPIMAIGDLDIIEILQE